MASAATLTIALPCRHTIKQVQIPWLMDSPEDVDISLSRVVLSVAAVAACTWYFRTRHWLANNLLGLCISVTGIEKLHLDSAWVGVVMLAGLFV